MPEDILFTPLAFRNLTVKNRIFRSNISGRFDNYDGSGNQARINWETKFAKGGVGAIISSFVPVHLRGRIVPNYATIHDDAKIPFWRALGKAVHAHECKYILQLSHGGRQRDINGPEYPIGLSSTDKSDPVHGFRCERMTVEQIHEVVQQFAEGAGRAQEAGLDGVELHGANGYLITQFLSSAINDREDEYGGPIENRARFVVEIVKAIRAKVGPGFHLQMKISAVDFDNVLGLFAHGRPAGNTLGESVKVCRMLVEAGVDAIHVSAGSFFPHPKNPRGADLPINDLTASYDAMISSGERTFLNYLLFRGVTGLIARNAWNDAAGPVEEIEGANLGFSKSIRTAVQPIPVICTGGFQTASVIRDAITRGDCDAVSIARSLVANNDLVQMFARGLDKPPKPCTYCNKCLVNVVENPLGCYDLTRFTSREEMIAQIMSVFESTAVHGDAAVTARFVIGGVMGVAWALAIAVAGLVWAPAGVAAQSDIVTHFKYGSVGTEGTVGLPYPIFRVLPVLFADKLPNRPGEGYERLGFIVEPNAPRGLPIGTTYVEDRVALVGLNCATCHTGTVRESPTSPRQIVLGMPAHQMDLQGYANFLTACANDPRFEAGTIIEAIKKQDPEFSFFSSLLYRFFVIKRTRDGILERAEQNAWFKERPPQGPGRVDTFNPYKRMFKFDLQVDTSVGTADLPPLFNQRPRQGLWLHWDGNNNQVEERNKSAAIGAGATEETLDLASLDRVAQWALDLKPPAFPATRVDRALAEKGSQVYRTACASCHAFDGARVGQVTPIADIATDPERLNSFTAALVEKMNTIGTGRPWKFSHFRKTDGYANMPLDGIWLRAPYLHNGSVPTLRALLFPDERPAVFYRGYDVYDFERVGFVAEGADAEKNGVRFDTTLRGNSNSGHVYGQELPAADRVALIEYLKAQ